MGANWSQIESEGSILLSRVGLRTAYAGIHDSEGHCFTHAVVVLPSALVGDFDLAAAVVRRIAGSLPGRAQCDDVISIFTRSSILKV